MQISAAAGIGVETLTTWPCESRYEDCYICKFVAFFGRIKYSAVKQMQDYMLPHRSEWSSGSTVAHVPAVREGPGSNRTVDKSLFSRK